MRDKPMTDKEYVELEISRCPYCEATDVGYGEIDLCAGSVYLEAYCHVCESDWQEVYRLDGYIGEGHKQDADPEKDDVCPNCGELYNEDAGHVPQECWKCGGPICTRCASYKLGGEACHEECASDDKDEMDDA